MLKVKPLVEGTTWTNMLGKRQGNQKLYVSMWMKSLDGLLQLEVGGKGTHTAILKPGVYPQKQGNNTLPLRKSQVQLNLFCACMCS